VVVSSDEELPLEIADDDWSPAFFSTAVEDVEAEGDLNGRDEEPSAAKLFLWGPS
jgi:hypothetical protein